MSGTKRRWFRVLVEEVACDKFEKPPTKKRRLVRGKKHKQTPFAILKEAIVSTVSPLLSVILAVILIMSNYTDIEPNDSISDTFIWSYNLLNDYRLIYDENGELKDNDAIINRLINQVLRYINKSKKYKLVKEIASIIKQKQIVCN